MKRIILAVALGALALSAHAQAQEGLYGGVSLLRAELDIDGAGSVAPLAVTAKLGKQINPNFAIEARASIGLADDSIAGVDVEIDHILGFYAKGMMPLSGGASIYGMVGYSSGKVTFSVPGASASESDSDLSLGLGAEFNVQPNVAAGIEWARLFKGDGYTLEGLAFGVTFKF